MDLGEKEKLGLETRGIDSLTCHTSGLATTVWNQIGNSPCSSASMADSFGNTLWNQPIHTNSSSFSNALEVATSSTIGKPIPSSWNFSDSVTKGELFLSPGTEILPLSLSQFPSDPGFTGRATRFSCFSGSVYPSIVPGTSDVIAEAQKQKIDAGKVHTVKDRPALIDQSSNSGSPMKEKKEKAGSEFSEQEFSAEAIERSATSARGEFGTSKRKRNNQDFQTDNKLKAEKSSSTIANTKTLEKNSKGNEETPKEDYIHVRARRGQATNSHSLAERVRREKISERMKFLQDLVPGCSKVTGKALMLDEIINYVQSLQRQVEFLSMKLAAINPSTDFIVEGLLSKDLFQTRTGSPSTELIQQQLHSSHQSLVQVGVPGIMNTSDAFRRALNFQLPSTSGYNDASQQMPIAWEDDLHNVVQMTFGNNLPSKIQGLNVEARDYFPL